MFSPMSQLRSAQQRHLSHTFLVKLKLFNSLTFPSPVSPFFQFVVPGHFMTCNTPGFSRIITNWKQVELDRGSIMSSLRYGFSTPYRLTIRNSARLFNIVLFNMGDLHLVLPALNLSTLNTGILIMMQQVRLMMFSLNMVDYSMSFLSLSTLLDK